MNYRLYVLELDGGRVYVGITQDFGRRYHQHCSGSGAKYTKKYRPIRPVLVINLGVNELSEAEKYEDAKTLELKMIYGDKCRGGHFMYDMTEYQVKSVYKSFYGYSHPEDTKDIVIRERPVAQDLD